MPFTSGTMMRLGKAEAPGLACRQQSRRSAHVSSATRTAAAAKAAVTAKSAKVESKVGEPVQAVTGLVFEPFSAVQGELATVNKTQEALESFARMDFHPECEAAINHQINVEYTVSYVYHALFCYFDRDNVALPGLAAYFKAGSVEEREHAELLMEYQNRRGGRVKLAGISMPQMEFGNAEKGDALYAMELALSLEKLNFTNLRQLHAVADKHGDAAFADFVEGALLDEQTEAVKKVSEYVSQLRRVGKGLGVYTFDKELAEAMKAQA